MSLGLSPKGKRRDAMEKLNSLHKVMEDLTCLNEVHLAYEVAQRMLAVMEEYHDASDPKVIQP